MSRSKRTRAFLLASAVLATAPMYSHGQTSGSWTFNGSGSWSVASNWNPSIPDAGGNALFYQNAFQNISPTITLDVPITLGTLTYDSVYQYVTPATLTNTLTLTGAATIAVPRSNASTPSLFAAGHVFSRPIAGVNGLTKTGSGIMTITATNTYSGGTTINGGVLRISAGDVNLGATGVGNDITINNATLRASTTAFTTSRNLTINGAGTFESFTATIFNGGINGSGNFTKTVSSLLTLQGTNTLSGSFKIANLGSGSVNLAAAGNMTAISSFGSNGTLTFDNTGVVGNNVLNRLSDTAPVTLSGGGINMFGNANATSSESIGAITTDAGQESLNVTIGAGQNTQLTAASWTRSNRSSMLFRGALLGNTPGAGVSNIFLTAAPTLVGGGGAAASTNISIIPAAAGGLTTTDGGTNFVTYGATGVRPLATTEYNANITGAAATDNVRKTATEAVAGAVTVNALNVATTAGITGAGTVTVTSGQVINSAASTAANTVNIDFGSAEGHINMASSGSFTGVISGSNGLTKSGPNTLRLGNANVYTGSTVINSSTVHITANVPANAPSAFGNSNDPIILQSGASQANLLANGANAAIDRPIIFRGNGVTAGRLGTAGTTELFTANGPIQLDAPMSMFGPSTTVPMTFNGKISGASRIVDSFSGLYAMNAANDFSGGTEMNVASIWDAGNDAAFGTGTIYLGSATAPTIRSAGGAHTFANPVMFAGGGLATAGSNPVNFSGPVNLNGGSGGTAWTVTVALTSPTMFSGVIQDGGLIKAGAGTLRLTGNNTYSGNTVLNVGTLDVSNTVGSGTGTGTVSVASGATLAGNGTISGTVAIAGGGIWSPGNTPGTLTEGATTLANTSSLVWELDVAGVVGGGINDLAAVNGNLTLDGALTVVQGPSFGAGTYTLITYSGLLTDNTLTAPTLTGGFTGTIDTTSQPGAVLLQVVPEPTTLGLLGMATAGLLARRRRRA